MWRRAASSATAIALVATAAVVGVPFETPFDALDQPMASAEGNPTPLDIPVVCTDDITAIAGQNLQRLNTTTGATTTIFTSTQINPLGNNGLASNTDDGYLYWGSGTTIYYYDTVTDTEGVFGDFPTVNGVIEGGSAAYLNGFYYFGVEGAGALTGLSSTGLYRVQVSPTDPSTFVPGSLTQIAPNQPAAGLTAFYGVTIEPDYGDILVTTNGVGDTVIYGSTVLRGYNNGSFWSYNVTTGAFNTLTTYNSARAYQLGLNTAGTLFGLSVTTGELVSINPTTGVHTTIVTTGPSLITDTAGAFCTAPRTPQLNLEKTSALTTDADGSGDVTVGDTITYTFTSTNIGNVPIDDVSISDPLPGLSALSCTPGQPVVRARGEELVCTATLTVTQPQADAGSIDNTATTTGTYDGATITDTGTDSVPVVQNASLDFTKTVSPTGPVDLGDTLTYTLTATNPGTVPLTGVTVTDPVPTGSTFVAASGSVTGPITFDNFSSGGYAAGAGWTGNWQEVNDGGGAAGATDGTCGPNNQDVCVLVDGVSGSQVLRVENDNNGIYRQVDLTSATAADLVYDFRRTALVGTAQWVAVYASATPPTNAARGTEIFRHAGGPGTATVTDAAFASNTIDLDAFAGAPVYISFFGNNGGMVQINGVNFDDISVEATRDPSDPPALTTTPVLPPGTSASYTFQVTVNDPRPTGVTSIDNTATADSDQTPPEQASTSNPLPPVADISGSVFDDVEQNETISAGDDPIDGVVIQLFEDADGNGVADGPAIATTVTLADGSYVFEDVEPGTYLVVETDPTGLASVLDTDGGNDNTISVTLDGSGADSTGNDFLDTGLDFGDGPASYMSASAVTNSTVFLGAGVTRDPAVVTDDSDVDDGVDFNTATVTTSGYTLPVAVTNDTGGSVWVCGSIDLDQNGTFEPSEQQCDEVLAGETEASLTWTGVGGLTGNSFTRFRVATTLAEAQQATGQTSAGEVEDYPINLATLPVTVAYFASAETADAIDVTWWSGTETGNAGYVLYGDQDGERVALTDLVVGAGDSFTPLEYSQRVSGGYSTLWLADVDLEGHETLHGPYQLGEVVGSVPAPVVLEWDTAQAEVDQVEAADQAERVADQNRATIESAAVAEISSVIESTVTDAMSAFTTSAAPSSAPVAGAGNSAVISVDAAGIYRITSNDLLDAGLDWRRVRMDSLAVIDSAGEPVPIRVSGGKKFRNNRFVEFVGEPLDTLYTGTNVYRLVVDPSKRVLMDVDRSRVRLRNDAVDTYLHTAVVENQSVYSAAAPGDDPWHAADIFSWSPPHETVVDVDHLAAGDSTINVTVWGALDFAPEIDHQVSVSVNGTPVGAVEFGGLEESVITATLPDGLLVDGANTVSVSVGLAPGMPFDWVNLDRVEVSYPREIVAVDGTAAFTASGDRFVVSGLTSLAVEILRVDADGDVARVRRQKLIEDVDGTFTISFSGTSAEATYTVTQIDSLLTPDVAAARTPAGLLDGSADLLIISHSAFSDHLGDLIAVREAQGLAVKVVEVEDLYAAYTGQVFDAAAISAYIADAADAFGDPAVLLVGADSRDYRNDSGGDSIAFIPSVYGDVGVGSIAWSPIDPAFVDLDGDRVPDLDLGRFPVRDLAELDKAIDKAIGYVPDDDVVLASEAGFGDIADEIAASLPGDTDVTTAHLDDLSVADARSVLLDGINDGAGLTVFFGHSSTDQWTSQGLLTTADAADLTNTEDPSIVVQFGCWNTYFSDPGQQSLGSALLTETGGASAVLGATTLTSSVHDAMFGPFLMEEVATSATVGSAMTAAKQEFASTMSAPDITMGWTLLGDPTTPLD